MSMNREQKRMLQRQGEVDSSNLSVATSIGSSVADGGRAGPAPAGSLRSEADMASDKRVQVTLECQGCRRRNYITTKSKVNTRERIELKKFCRWCRSHVDHKETR